MFVFTELLHISSAANGDKDTEFNLYTYVTYNVPIHVPLPVKTYYNVTLMTIADSS